MVVSIAQAQLFFLALTRVLAILIHVPVLAGQGVPNPVKIGLGVLLTMVIIPWEPLPPEAASLDTLAFGFAIARELLLGTLAGFAAALTFACLQVAGELMSTGSGFASARVLNPAMDFSGSPLDQFFLLFTTLIFLVINGHHTFLLGLQRTFELFPLNSPLPDFSLEVFARMTAQLITAGVQMALPVMGALLLTDLVLGLLSRVAPQVQVFFLGAPLKAGLGIFFLLVTLGVLLPAVSGLFERLGERMLLILGL